MTLGSLLRWQRFSQVLCPATPERAEPGEFSAVLEATYPGDPNALSEQSVRAGRYTILLDREATPDPMEESSLAAVWTALEEEMALVPAGQITPGGIETTDSEQGYFAAAPVSRSPIMVQAFYLDRYAVTNNDFVRFVAAGGYDQMEFWPQEIWPSVVQFIDQTGLPGPKFWSHGRPPRGRESHPVVGISWYEASAYARWLGKRLPTAAEWEKAGSWPADLSGRGPKMRYPWGNSFDSSRANTWISGLGDTVPVDQYPSGCTPNGIYQLVGNVWEWVADRYDGPAVLEGLRVFFDQPMGEIRGGAFDTYFEIQTTCQFRTGKPLLKREANLGFRCAISADHLRPRPDP